MLTTYQITKSLLQVPRSCHMQSRPGPPDVPQIPVPLTAGKSTHTQHILRLLVWNTWYKTSSVPPRNRRGGGFGQLAIMYNYWSVLVHFIEGILYTWKEGGAPGKKRGVAPPFPPLRETLTRVLTPVTHVAGKIIMLWVSLFPYCLLPAFSEIYKYGHA